MLHISTGDNRVDQYKVGRRIATIAVILGWILVALPLITVVYIVVSVIGPGGVSFTGAAILPALVIGGVGGVVVAMLGQVARAVFDIAEHAARKASA